MAGLALCRIEELVIGTYGAERDITELPPVRKELQVLGTEFGMALAAIILVMAAVAMLRIVQRLEGMDFQPVAPVTFGRVIGLVIPGREFCINPASLVTVEAEVLVMAVPAILFSLI
jgi:hypothetical protein